jgi:CheY-like chemotaxis protein
VSTPAGSKKVIVIAEDYPDISQLVTDLLRDEGYDMVAVSRGGEVLGAVKKHHPAVILLDLALPDIPRNEVLQQLSHDQDTCNIPVVIISAYSERLRRVPQVRAVINKPFEIDALIRAVTEAQEEPKRAA